MPIYFVATAWIKLQVIGHKHELATETDGPKFLG